MWVCTHPQSLQSCLSLWTYGLHPTRVLYPWDSPGKTMEWVAMSSSRGSSQPRDWIWVSLLQLLKCRWILYHWATAPMWVGLIQSVDGLNKKADLPLSRREFFLPDCLQTETLAFSCPWIQTEPLALPGSWSCRPSDRATPLAHSSRSQLAHSPSRSWDLPSSIIMLPNLLQ